MDITLEQFLEMVIRFNQIIYPTQWAAMLLAIIAVVFAFIRKPFSNALIIGTAILFSLISALAFWLPMGLQNCANGYLYMAMFILQSGLLLSAAAEDELHFHFEAKPLPILGLLFVCYGLFIYPLIGLLTGHTYPELIFSPLFPCPMNIWLMGMLLMTDKPVPRYTMIIPFIWGLIGILWVALGITEDIGLIITNLIGPGLLVFRDRGKRMGLHY